MANDALDVDKELFPFRPCDTPRGNLWYDKEALTFAQKQQLNDLKIATIKENNRYLAKHPEVRALIVLLLRSYFRDKPRCGIARHAGNFFSRPKVVIAGEVKKYLRQRGEPRKKEGNSAVNLSKAPKSKVSITDIFRNDFSPNLSDDEVLPDIWDWWQEQTNDEIEEQEIVEIKTPESQGSVFSLFMLFQSYSDVLIDTVESDPQNIFVESITHEIEEKLEDDVSKSKNKEEEKVDVNKKDKEVDDIKEDKRVDDGKEDKKAVELRKDDKTKKKVTTFSSDVVENEEMPQIEYLNPNTDDETEDQAYE